MGYTMKRGNSAVPFSELGSSPAKDNTGAHDKFKTETEHEEYHDVNPTENLSEAEMKKASKKKGKEEGPESYSKADLAAEIRKQSNP